jgi:hypothetical protein
MGHQTLPSGINDLLLLAERMVSGLETHGPWLGMTQIPADEFRRSIDETGKAESAWTDARNAKAYSQTRMAAADATLAAWLAKARLVVMLARGEKWSKRWIETGFTHRAAKVPKRFEPRVALARRLVVFLALHPDFAVPFAQVTAAHGRTIYEWTFQTHHALEIATTDCRMKKRQRDAAERVLRRTMRQVFRVLSGIIARGDPRWLAFGLSQSATDSPRKGHFPDGSLTPALPEPIPLPPETRPDRPHTVAA